MSLCTYRNALGVPGEGVHSYRLFNIALADVALAIALALLIRFVCRTSLLISFLIGIVVHRLFCVRTTLDRLLFPSQN